LQSHEQLVPLEIEDVDARGVRRPGALKNKLQRRLIKAHAVSVPKVTEQELKEIENH
jgi:ubiquinol-cytochrome c reductase cytochrome b subunit